MDKLTDDLFKIIDRLNGHIDSTKKKIARLEKQERSNPSLAEISSHVKNLRLEVVYMLRLGSSIASAIGLACKRQSAVIKTVSKSKRGKKDI